MVESATLERQRPRIGTCLSKTSLDSAVVATTGSSVQRIPAATSEKGCPDLGCGFIPAKQQQPWKNIE